MKFRPLQIPGKSIKAPDPLIGYRCPYCRKFFLIPKKKTNPRTQKVKLLCPYCGQEL